MSIIESIITAMFCLSLVFIVLFILCAMVKLLSLVVGIKSGGKTGVKASEVPEGTGKENTGTVQVSTGELKLKNVDEKTAALIMAIVSDESKIPLSELCFKSIKAVD